MNRVIKLYFDKIQEDIQENTLHFKNYRERELLYEMVKENKPHIIDGRVHDMIECKIYEIIKDIIIINGKN